MARAAQSTHRHLGGYIRDVPDRPPPARTKSPRFQPEVEEEEDMDEIEIREKRPSGHIPEPPITKTGRPDRRFLGARHLPSEEEVNPDYRRARTGGMIGNIHVTISGKPDRRFKENRGLSDEEAMQQWAQILNQQYLRH